MPLATEAFEARIGEKRQLSPNVFHLTLELQKPPSLTFRAGQFIQFLIAPRILRQYSICSPPSQTNVIELCVDVSPGGEGSRFVLELEAGDPVKFRGPFGVFIVPSTEQRPVEFVATGAGIAPIRAMILDILEASAAPPFRLLFGNRFEEHLLYHTEFMALAEKHPRFAYLPTLTRPREEWKGERGRVTEVLNRSEGLLGRPYFLCGSPEMVDDTRKVLREKGVPEQDVHFEKFY